MKVYSFLLLLYQCLKFIFVKTISCQWKRQWRIPPFDHIILLSHSVVILRALNDVKRKELEALLCSRNCISVPSAADCVKLLPALIGGEVNSQISANQVSVSPFTEVAHLGGRYCLAELSDSAKPLRGISKDLLACSMTGVSWGHY